MVKSLTADREEPKPRVSAQRRRLWEAMHSYIRQHGGWVVSPPAGKVMRLEVPDGSTLPTKLVDLGYEPRHAGRTTRIEANNFIVTDFVEITLGK